MTIDDHSLAIRHATQEDLGRCLEIVDSARAFMRAHGNSVQWHDGYPGRDVLEHDLGVGSLYVCVDDEATSLEEDPAGPYAKSGAGNQAAGTGATRPNAGPHAGSNAGLDVGFDTSHNTKDGSPNAGSEASATSPDRLGTPLACFAMMAGPEPTYARIEQGAWLNDEPYLVFHRLAVGASGRGVGTFCLRWIASQAANVRGDTHELNLPMRGALEKCGFVPCGIIHVSDGTPRIAYQHVR